MHEPVLRAAQIAMGGGKIGVGLLEFAHGPTHKHHAEMTAPAIGQRRDVDGDRKGPARRAQGHRPVLDAPERAQRGGHFRQLPGTWAIEKLCRRPADEIDR